MDFFSDLISDGGNFGTDFDLVTFRMGQKRFFKKKYKGDTYLFWNTISLVAVGFIIFLSASLGLLSRFTASELWGAIIGHVGLGLVVGSVAAYVSSRIPYLFWRKISFYMFIIASLLTLAVFIPGIGISHGGATRWLNIGGFSLQPAELLKVSYLIYLATWLTVVGKHVKTFKHGFLPYGVITLIVGLILLPQPDTDTFFVIAITGGVMYFAAGATWKHLALGAGAGIVGLITIVMIRPYIWERILTFLDPSRDPLNSGYQVQQSLIAIGSGGFTGRGFGQSVQKFSFLPEPTSDSIFAVAAEEFGFIGTTLILILYISLTLRLYVLASRQKERFGKFLLIGAATMIFTQVSMNIASMLGLFPLSGLPLLFMSHGGTALFFTLVTVGIAYNVTRKRGNT